jgi:hypothetical protein
MRSRSPSMTWKKRTRSSSAIGLGRILTLTDCGHESAMFSGRAVYILGQLQVRLPAEQALYRHYPQLRSSTVKAPA